LRHANKPIRQVNRLSFSIFSRALVLIIIVILILFLAITIMSRIKIKKNGAMLAAAKNESEVPDGIDFITAAKSAQ
jgi:hypothetical protein